ncbi:hypothetical protein NLU13_8607 [Sarocladium strictum]|uniref:FAD/NAD(P)-binding domain-containing protein n=1 Tax=Sarocladium strictum TaxID=5046 RepID=A0AA39GCJ2_SARSR|nr:hypothetical protein NLU13_8607 [Sarocladium strictum]
MFRQTIVWLKIISKILGIAGSELKRQLRFTRVRLQRRFSEQAPPPGPAKNIVVVGANFAGFFAAEILAKSLLPSSGYQVVVIEPNSHFQFSWLLPRFCVVEGHEHKAFIPYEGWRKNLPDGILQWVKDRVVSISRSHVKLRDGTEIQYEYLIIATGSGVEEGLPSRVNHTEKLEGIRRLQEMQKGIKAAKSVVIVGGGAAGVEVATDAKDLYPEKQVTIVHSRDALMHRFGKKLQDEALEGMQKLGVDVILGERVLAEDAAMGTVTLSSGTVLHCDKFVNCTGQKPTSGLMKELSPSSIAETGHIRVKPTLQVADDTLPNVYACGDVADTGVPTPNARSASRQAAVAADNILASIRGRQPSYAYQYSWPVDSFIKLTLGLYRSTTYMGDGKESVVFRSKEKIDLMSEFVWQRFGSKPFEDDNLKSD